MKYIFGFTLLIISLQASAQCLPQEQTYIAGEEIWYDVKYNWSFIWVDAGEVVFAVEDAKWEGLDAFWFKGYGRSMPKWDWIYKVRDSFDAIGTKGQLAPQFFSRKTIEGGYSVDNEYRYSSKNNTINASLYNSKADKITIKEVPYEGCIWDVLSAIYYARNLDYNGMKPNQKIPFNLIVDGKINNLFVRYLGKEILEMPSGKKYKTIKFSALLVEGTIFDGGEDMTVWVTDDKNKIPLKVEAKIQVGWIKAFLTKTKGLKYPELKPLDQ